MNYVPNGIFFLNNVELDLICKLLQSVYFVRAGIELNLSSVSLGSFQMRIAHLISSTSVLDLNKTFEACVT